MKIHTVANDMQNADLPTILRFPFHLPRSAEADMNGHTQASGTSSNRTAKSLLLLCLAAILNGPASRIAAAETITSVTILTFAGKTEISRRQGAWDPAHTNQVLLVGDRLRTAKDSQATVRLSDGTIMRVGAQASFQVMEPKRRTSLNPLSGLFYFFHRDRPGEWELRSRTAVAAVRGTEFHLEAAEDGTWVLSVIEGEVELHTEMG